MAKEISFEIKKHLEVLFTSNTGWTRELNIVSWNGGKPKYDIRDWSSDHEKMGKGITLNGEQAEMIIAAISADDSGIVE